MKFSGVITIDKSDVIARDQDQRPKVKVTEVKTQFSRFQTVTPEMKHKSSIELPYFFQGHPSNFKVTWDKISPFLTRIKRFRTVAFLSRSSIKFQDYTGQKMPILTQIERFQTVTQV